MVEIFFWLNKEQIQSLTDIVKELEKLPNEYERLELVLWENQELGEDYISLKKNVAVISK